MNGENGLGTGLRRALLLVALAVVASPLFAERQPLSRYRSIVDRHMFGQPPEGFDPTKPPSAVSAREEKTKDEERAKEEEKIKSAVKFSMINFTPEGATAVGFTDSSDPKNPVNYYLKVGETRNGWTVREADAIKATMTIVKDDIEVELKLGGDSSQGGARKAGTARAAGPLTRPRSNVLGGSEAVNSLRARRQLRAQEKAAQAAADEAARKRREAEIAAREAEREAKQAAEREEQRTQLLAIQEELKKVRESKRAEAEAPREAREE